MSIIINKNFEACWKENLPAEIYHADKTAVNSSSLKTILKSPASFKAVFFKDVKPEETDAMRFGSLVHLAILEGAKFRERYVIKPDFGDMRSSKNRELRDAWRAENQGKTICTQQELDKILFMIDSVMNHKDACKLLTAGATEISGYFADPETGILNRIRPDFISFNLSALVDIKTCQDCTMDSFSKTIWNYRYDFQMAMYCEGAKIISRKPIEYPVFIAIEKEPPFEVACYIADQTVIEIGAGDYRKSLLTLKHSLDKNEWGPYQNGFQNISLPNWVIQRMA